MLLGHFYLFWLNSITNDQNLINQVTSCMFYYSYPTSQERNSGTLKDGIENFALIAEPNPTNPTINSPKLSPTTEPTTSSPTGLKMFPTSTIRL
mmetsp:Transcript_19320/g.24584  ORF Transcript_19320/g.24584 Transcript_19320/m.24584 type:complete len:94 (-) Transcript_19320:61-342(-)